LTFKKAPVVNNEGNIVDSPKQPLTPSSPKSNGTANSAPVTPKSDVPKNDAPKSSDLAAYGEEEKELNIDDIDLGEFGGDNFDADNYFKKLASDLVSIRTQYKLCLNLATINNREFILFFEKRNVEFSLSYLNSIYWILSNR
jgi:hypothetical protein